MKVIFEERVKRMLGSPAEDLKQEMKILAQEKEFSPAKIRAIYRRRTKELRLLVKKRVGQQLLADHFYGAV